MPMENSPRLVCRGLCKAYGPVRAVQDVDLDAAPGVTALIGHNGAGKTTLMRLLATLARPDKGNIRFDGLDAARDTARLRARLGYLGHESLLDEALTPRENLRLFGRLYGVREPAARAEALLARFGAQSFADKPVRELSRGQEQLTGLCRALMHEPGLLLLDEPSASLDAAAGERLWQAAREHADTGAVVIFSTHDHAAARKVADRVIELRQGSVVAGT
jgi:ABC-type multidrug transport system ATPase subunit